MMIPEPIFTADRVTLWFAFLAAYRATRHRCETDRFLRALIGAPRPADSR